MIDPSKVFDGARHSEHIKNIYHVIMPHPESGELSKIGKYTSYGSFFVRKKIPISGSTRMFEFV